MFNLLNLNPIAFGLDITDASLKFVKLRKKREGYLISAFGELSLPKGMIKGGQIKHSNALAVQIRKMMSQAKGVKTRYVIVSLPEEKSFAQVISMPKMTEAEAKKAVYYEAENYIPFSVNKVYLDCQKVIPLRKDLDHSEFLIAALPKTIVDSYLGVLRKAKLSPLALEIEPQSISRALVKNETSLLPQLLMDIGATRTTFVLFSGRSLRFSSSIPISSNLFTTAISKNLKKSSKKAESLKIKYGLKRKTKEGKEVFDALIPILTDFQEQVNKHIEYYHSHATHKHLPRDGSSIKKIILCGGGANLFGLPEFLQSELGLPVELGNPLINLSLTKSQSPIPKEKLLGFTIAIGLALRGARGEQ